MIRTTLLIVCLMLAACTQNLAGKAVFLEPVPANVSVGEEVRVDIHAAAVQNLAGVQLNVNYDSALLEYVSIQQGSFLSEQGSAPTVLFTQAVDVSTPGTVKNIVLVRLDGLGTSGDGVLASLTFRAKQEGLALFYFENIILGDQDGMMIPTEHLGSSIAITEGSTPPPPPPPPIGEPIYLEAESGVLVEPMRIYNNKYASGNQYITALTSEAGSATYTITIPETGTYIAWGRVMAPGANRDSFYVSVDGQQPFVWESAQGSWRGSLFQWTRVTDHITTGNTEPHLFQLTAGTHTITISGRDRYAYLDQLVFTNNLNFDPEAEPEPPAPPPAGDTVPPVRTGSSPSGTIAPTTSTTLQLSTDEVATCRYGTIQGTAYSQLPSAFGGASQSHAAAVSSLQEGQSYTYYVRCQDGAGNQNTDDFAISFTVGIAAPPPPPGSNIEIEAETGILTQPMRTYNNKYASGSEYITTVSSEAGDATYTITIPETGTYIAWGRVMAPGTSRDAYYVTLDNEPRFVWESAQGSWRGSLFQWTRVTDHITTGNTEPHLFQLTAGTHMLKIGGKDRYAYLDKLLFTQDANFVPDDE